MANHGARVLVLESETQFRDRNRGEVIVSWGVLEAQKLGIYDAMKAAGARELEWEERSAGLSFQTNPTVERHMPSTTVTGTPKLTFYHPHMQEAVLQLAMDSGATVHRGARVRGVQKADLNKVTANVDGVKREFTSRLVVGADGRSSGTRNWGSFNRQRRQAKTFVAGILFDDMDSPDDRTHHHRVYDRGICALLFPQGNGRVRAYACYPQDLGLHLSGGDDIKQFVNWSIEAGTPGEYFRGVSPVGTLASFDSSATWVDHPYNDGIVLIGDAAGATDPMFGQGVSLTFRDVRVLRDKLMGDEDWDKAGSEYAEEHDRYFRVCSTVIEWNERLLAETGREADARRETAFSSWRTDPSRRLDTNHSGPDHPVDENTRKRFFGEE